MKYRGILLMAAAASLAFLGGCADDDDGFISPDERVFEVSLENLTTGQPMSPGVIVTHDARVDLWSEGSAASEGIRLIAENGDPSTAMNMLMSAQGVQDLVMIDAPIHRKGGPGPDTATYRITAGEEHRLSLATMLICTNDAFTGVDSVALPEFTETLTYMAVAYDAGTEMNDELFSSIPDPCQAVGPVMAAGDGNSRTATSGLIEMHPGVQGSGDLTMADHGWQDPVLRISVRRVQ